MFYTHWANFLKNFQRWQTPFRLVSETPTCACPLSHLWRQPWMQRLQLLKERLAAEEVAWAAHRVHLCSPRPLELESCSVICEVQGGCVYFTVCSIIGCLLCLYVMWVSGIDREALFIVYSRFLYELTGKKWILLLAYSKCLVCTSSWTFQSKQNQNHLKRYWPSNDHNTHDLGSIPQQERVWQGCWFFGLG